ncbi:aminodeoxychorismate synthase component I [Fundidesulfovibrio agrisoli]|uniref:aminodeoxychorismate synthase component I n=1 Tax=Fundidesulfovibrio agrisoli TaxID=2922717 RepID=UPI001FAB4D3B|nr:aminodeoxychorismate synthase component I [Fundidesulfovibrio agrisoli]
MFPADTTESPARPGLAVFRSFSPWGGWSMAFDSPREVIAAHDAAGVLSGIERVQAATEGGAWAVLALAYEAASAFNPAFPVRDTAPLPLLWAAIYPRPARLPEADPALSRSDTPWNIGPWRAAIDPDEYADNIGRIREYIRQGETYQVNYTFPLEADFQGDALSWFQAAGRAQGAPWSAYVDMGRFALLSFSPELFFRRKGRAILTRPMKGTAPKGRFRQETVEAMRRLAACPKNRAENVMIVDLLRSDLGRIAVPGGVKVERLFQVSEYPTVLQMTSSVRARLKPGTGLADIFGALFPCGSVTGAPKLRTMGLIGELEPHPRGVYCGALGYVGPGGDAVFNVPIRTVQLDRERGKAVFHVGSGVTFDSTPEGEYGECLHKARFLTEPSPEVTLLETLLLENGRLAYLRGHLDRLARSARHFGFAFRREAVLTELRGAVAGHPSGSWRVRLLYGRNGDTTVEVHHLDPTPATVTLGFCPTPVNSADVRLFHKTTDRYMYDAALRGVTDAWDMLLFNERGELTESTRANVVLDDGQRLWTPPVECGLLGGVFRERLLASGRVRERVLHAEDVRGAKRLYLVNSLRRWMPAVLRERDR